MSFLKRLVPVKAEMILDYQNEDIGAAHRVKGYAKIESEDTFSVEQVFLKVTVQEERRINNKVDVHPPLYSKDINIGESFNATVGVKRDFPFEIEIPDYDATHGGAIWTYVKAVAKLRGRPDLIKNKNYVS
jgi:hypothetical protein